MSCLSVWLRGIQEGYELSVFLRGGLRGYKLSICVSEGGLEVRSGGLGGVSVVHLYVRRFGSGFKGVWGGISVVHLSGGSGRGSTMMNLGVMRNHTFC